MGVRLSYSTWYWKITLKFLAPILIICIVLLTITNITPCYYGDYIYPDYIQVRISLCLHISYSCLMASITGMWLGNGSAPIPANTTLPSSPDLPSLSTWFAGFQWMVQEVQWGKYKYDCCSTGKL